MSGGARRSYSLGDGGRAQGGAEPGGKIGKWGRFCASVRSFMARWFGVLDDPDSVERYKAAKVRQQQAIACKDFADAVHKLAMAKEIYERSERAKAQRRSGQQRKITSDGEGEAIEDAISSLEGQMRKMLENGGDVEIDCVDLSSAESEEVS
jgi:hypothetical protein